MDITTGRRLKSIALTLAVTAIGFGQNAATSRTANLTPASLPYIDAHTHIYQLDPEGAVTLILSAMERLNGAKAFIQTEAVWARQSGALGRGDDPAGHKEAPGQARRAGRRRNAQSDASGSLSHGQRRA